MHSQNLINIIADQLPELNKSESKVARVILADPDRATSSSIAPHWLKPPGLVNPV